MMEKALYDLKVDEEFRSIVPPLSGEAYTLLEEDILIHGILYAVAVWNDIIVDGNNRYDIAKKHGIPFAIQKMDFGSRDEAFAWIITSQFGRRNLDDYSKGVLVLQYEEKLKERGRKRMSVNQRGGLPMLANQTTRDTLAEMAGISHGTLAKIKAIHENGDEEIERQIRSGKLSINKAFKDIRGEKKPEKKEAPKGSKAAEENEAPEKETKTFDPERDLAQIDEPMIVELPGEEEITRPSHFEDVVEQFGYVHQDYMMNIKASLEWITKKNIVPGGKEQIGEQIRLACNEALELLEKRCAEVTE